MSAFSFAKAKHLRLGAKGESIACKYLVYKGFDIICRDFKVSSGEIDIVARDGATLCFVEVKTRRSTAKCRPAAGLSETQKGRIHRAAMRYIRQIGRPALKYRFDLIEIVVSRWDITEFRYWPCHFIK